MNVRIIKLRRQYWRYWTLGRRLAWHRLCLMYLAIIGQLPRGCVVVKKFRRFVVLHTFPKNGQLPWGYVVTKKFRIFVVWMSYQSAQNKLHLRDACGHRPNVQYLRYWRLNLILLFRNVYKWIFSWMASWNSVNDNLYF